MALMITLLLVTIVWLAVGEFVGNRLPDNDYDTERWR